MTYTFKGFRKSLYHPAHDPHAVLIEEIGPGYAVYRREWEETTRLELERAYPVQLDFELNVSCNLKCPMCTWSAEATAGEGTESWMDFDFFRQTVTDGVRHGLRAVNLNYVNEPLIRRDLPRFVRCAREAGAVEVMFNTNGLLLTERLARELIEAGLTKLSFSVDAATAETYRVVRVGGDFARLLRNIRRFVEIRAEMGARIPLLKLTFLKMSANAHELDEFVAAWRDTAELFSIQNLYNPFDGELGRERERYFVTGVPTAVTGTPRCPSPFQRLTVRANGDVLPCCNMRAADRLVMGNAREQDVHAIWLSGPMKEIRAMHREGRYRDNPVCRACVEQSDAWAPEPR